MAETATTTPEATRGTGVETPPAPSQQPTQDAGRARDASGRFTAAAAEEPSLLDWRSTMPEDIRNEAVLQQYKTVADAAKALVHANRLIGRSVQLPEKPPHEDPEGWGKAFERLGRPAAPDKYEIQYPDLPDGLQWDPEHQRVFQEWAHNRGLSNWQAQGMAELWHNINVANNNRVMAEEAESAERAKKVLYERHGPSAVRRVQEASLLLDMLGRGAIAGESAERFRIKAIEKGFDNDPDFVDVCSAMFRHIGEGEYYDNELAPAGASTAQGMRDRARQLSAKERKEGLTEAEAAEKTRLYNRIAGGQEREGRTALRGAPML